MALIHSTSCKLDFNESIAIFHFRTIINRLVTLCDLITTDDRTPNTLANDLCSIIDYINELKEEHLPNIYPIFDKIDKLASEVRKLPK